MIVGSGVLVLQYEHDDEGPGATLFELLVVLVGQFLCRINLSTADADHLPYEWPPNGKNEKK
jgi:hypothetical protein